MLALILWLVLASCGYVYLRIAPLDPHNIASIPGVKSRVFWSCLAATSFLLALFSTGSIALTFASFAAGTILSPGLNDPYILRKDEDASPVRRFLYNRFYKFAGGKILKVISFFLAYLSSSYREDFWLFALFALAIFSIGGRTGILLALGRSREQIDADLKQEFGDQIPPDLKTLGEDTAKIIVNTSNSDITRGLNPAIAKKVLLSKRREEIFNWRNPKVVLPRFVAAVLSLAVWILAVNIFLINEKGIALDASNYNSALGLLFGILIGSLI